MRLLSRATERKRAQSASALSSPSPLDDSPPASPTASSSSQSSSSWTMELSRWRVRLRRLKRWRKYEGRASDGQLMPVSPCPSVSSSSTSSSTSAGGSARTSLVPHRHSMTSVDTYEFVIPPVCIPAAYRQQDRQRGVCVGGERVPFTLDGHLRRRRLIRALDRVEEQAPLDSSLVPDMRRSTAGLYALHARSRRACSV